MFTSITALLGGLAASGVAYAKDKGTELIVNEVKEYLLNNMGTITQNVLDYIAEKGLKPENKNSQKDENNDQVEKIKTAFNNFFTDNYNEIENQILVPKILKPVFEGLKSLANKEAPDEKTHQELKKFIETSKEEINNTVKKLTLQYIFEPILNEIDATINAGENEESSKIYEEIKKTLHDFKEKNLDKIKKKLKETMSTNPSLNILASIAIPDAEIERIRAALELIRMDYLKNSFVLDLQNNFKHMSFDFAKYHIIGDLTSYNNKNSLGIDPLINSTFKGQARINNSIIKYLNVYIAEKKFLKKYYDQLNKISNHKKYLTDVLSSLKKMYNILYVVQQKIKDTNRFSSKKAFAYYLNSYTTDKKITPDKLPDDIRTWDDYIGGLSKIINTTLTNILDSHIKTVSELLKNPETLDPTTNGPENKNKIKNILEYYLDPEKEAKNISPYTTNKKGIKKFISKEKDKFVSNVINKAKISFTSNMLDTRMLLCPYIKDQKYLGFKFVKDTIIFLKEYNNAANSITKIWRAYVDIPKQISINKKLINQLEKYRSIKYKLERALKEKEVNPKKLVNIKIDIKKNLEKIEKICTIQNIKETYGWNSKKLNDAKINLNDKSKEKDFSANIKEQMTLITQTFDYMEKSCENETAMLWENYIQTINEITKNTKDKLNEIIALENKDTKIKMDFKALEMKQTDYKVLMKKDLDKVFNDEANKEKLENLFKKDRYKEKITVDIGNKNFEKIAKSLEAKCAKQKEQIETLKSKKEDKFTYHDNLLKLLGIITIKPEDETAYVQNDRAIIKEFTDTYNEILKRYAPDTTTEKSKDNNSTPSVEYTLNLKNKMNNQTKCISKLNKLLKEITDQNNEVVKTILDKQKDIKKQQDKYNSSYKNYNKYCAKHKITPNLPEQKNDIFVNIGKINKDNIETVIASVQTNVNNAKNSLDGLINNENEKIKKQIKHNAYTRYLHQYVNFIANKVKEKTAT